MPTGTFFILGAFDLINTFIVATFYSLQHATMKIMAKNLKVNKVLIIFIIYLQSQLDFSFVYNFLITG